MRLLPLVWLTVLALIWLVVGEAITDVVWDPPAWADPVPALLIAVHVGQTMVVKYPVIPWTAMMMLGWAFGNYLTRYLAGDRSGWTPVRFLTVTGIGCMLLFVVVRGVND